jgi:hypothetical protein
VGTVSGPNLWCGREDSNLHGVAPASPSSWCVCQFRHCRDRKSAAASLPYAPVPTIVDGARSGAGYGAAGGLGAGAGSGEAFAVGSAAGAPGSAAGALPRSSKSGFSAGAGASAALSPSNRRSVEARVHT